MTYPVEAQARDHLAEPEHAALRRVATLVAEGVAPAELFATVVEEVGRVLSRPAVVMDRYEPDGSTTVVAATNVPGFPTGSRWPLDGPSLAATVLETGRSARIDDYANLEGTIAGAIRAASFRSSVGVPIVVEGAVWGLLCVGTTTDEPLPPGTEHRIRDFTELVAIAISNAESRDRLRRLAEQQASLRRVATLVAEGATPTELFSAVAEEVARIVDASLVSIVRYEPDPTAVVVASLDAAEFPVGSRWPVDGASLFATVLETGQPARIDDYSELPGPVAAAARASGVQSGLGVPIIVDGSVWGMVAVGRRQRRGALPAFTGSYSSRIVFSTESTADVEARLAAFTQLVATAIANSEARDALRLLADEQAALRRVATLVARGTDSQAIFDAVCAEACRLIDATSVNLSQYTSDGFNLMIAGWSFSGTHVPVGNRLALAPDTVGAVIKRTGAPTRVDSYAEATSEAGRPMRGQGVRSTVAAPVVVEGEVWGALIAGGDSDEPLAEGAEERLARFTELIATAISNAAARGELIASRARIVAAGDEARRRFERNLHDGTQQRLAALSLDLQRIRATIPESDRGTRAELEEAQRDVESVLEEVREVSRGLHPAQLAHGGLGPALRALAARSPIETGVDVRLEERPPQQIETAVYYVVSEAVANAIKHSDATKVAVVVAGSRAALHANIVDDGVGGAAMGTGSGLMGLNDRVEALGGRFVLASPRGGGTTISIELPISAAAP